MPALTGSTPDAPALPPLSDLPKGDASAGKQKGGLPSLSSLEKSSDNAPSGKLPPDLPPLTALTGDENAKRETANSKVTANDLPPLSSLSGATPPETPARSAKPEIPAAPAVSAAPVTDTSGEAPALRIPFNESETDIPLGINDKIDHVADALNKDPALRVTILAYASGPESSGIYPKRVALARGIAVRNYLTTNKSVDIERVNVKALGNKNAGGPPDRVDIMLSK
jgi:outer membrane protein OmpA-like peptidoglycan-associated protein